MSIELNKVVSLTYTLTAGKINEPMEAVETATGEHPFVFLFGASGLPEKFEESISGLQIGDAFSVALEAEEAYGLYDMEGVMEFPMEMFKDDDGNIDLEVVQVDNFLQLIDDDGFMHRAKVLEIAGDKATLDFNHPLAGHNLHFEGKVVGIRMATEDELAHGHVHGEGGVEH